MDEALEGKKALTAQFHDVFQKNLETCQKVRPRWGGVKTAICLASDNNYAPYLCVCIKSIAENCSRKKDIIIFETNITKENKDSILKEFSQPDMSIRFINPSFLFKNIALYAGHLREEAYYRLAAPVLMPDYDKIIYTDMDLIVLDDLLKLAEFDMGDCPVAACIDTGWRNWVTQNAIINDTDIRYYAKHVLKLFDPIIDYNSGVLVFNVLNYNKLNSFENLLEVINSHKFLFQDQDALNMIFTNRFYTLPSEWNFQMGGHPNFLQEYKNLNHLKILHWTGPSKPWKSISNYLVETWWAYASKTPFFERLFLDTEQLKKHGVFKYQFFDYYRYKLMAKFSHGTKRTHYQLKYQALNAFRSHLKRLRRSSLLV